MEMGEWNDCDWWIRYSWCGLCVSSTIKETQQQIRIKHNFTRLIHVHSCDNAMHGLHFNHCFLGYGLTSCTYKMFSPSREFILRLKHAVNISQWTRGASSWFNSTLFYLYRSKSQQSPNTLSITCFWQLLFKAFRVMIEYENRIQT